MTGIQNGSPPRWPDFIHVGPPRTGTTWLHEVLIGHCGLPKFKETHFFEAEYRRGADWYLSLFQNPDRALPIGEIAPTYFSNRVVRERIKEHIPDCKIILTFRDPAERLYSLYRLARKKRQPVPETFDGYWRAIVDSGSEVATYATQLRAWQRTFGEENLLVLFYDDLVADRQTYLNRICDFIGIPRVSLAQSPVGDSHVFDAPGAAKPNSLSRRIVVAIDWIAKHGGERLVQFGKNSQIRNKVRDLFVVNFESLSRASADELLALMLPETEELEKITGRDLSQWKPGGKRPDQNREARIQTNPF